MGTDNPTYGTIDRDYEAKLRSTSPEDDGPIYMVNLMRYHERAQYADGRETDLSGKEADDLYAPLGPLAKVGAEVAFFGEVLIQAFNEDPKWDRVGVIRYPSRQAFVDMQSDPQFQDLHEHKEAGMAETYVIGCLPMEIPSLPEGIPPLDQVSHPSTAEDGQVTVVHVIKFKDPDQLGDMETYQNVAGRIGMGVGVRVGSWMNVEGTIVGDGERWDQVRFNIFPSLAGLLELAEDPERLKVQEDNRKAAIETTYTFVIRPLVNRIPEMVGSGYSHLA